MNPSESNNSLSPELDAWRLAPSRTPDFRPQVLARISAARARQPWSGYARGHAPAFAGALAVAILLGAWVGREEARSRVALERARIATVYVQALDARTMRMP